MTCAETSYPLINSDAGPGHPGHLTAQQKAILEQLREQLQIENYTERLDDPSLLRFLRARKFDLAKAHDMFTNCEQWRKNFGVDDIVRTFEFVERPAVSKYYPQYYHKQDKDGRPVYIEQLGNINLTEMYKITTPERLLQFLVWQYEQFANVHLVVGNLMDLKGVGISSLTQVYSYVKQVSTIGQNYYPERMGKFYMINAPFGIASAFRLIKPLLDPATVEKISILGTNYQSVLLEQIPAENLPEKFGGSCVCPEGCELSDAGVWKDENYARKSAGELQNT